LARQAFEGAASQVPLGPGESVAQRAGCIVVAPERCRRRRAKHLRLALIGDQAPQSRPGCGVDPA
jgi:hypothetical protein